MKALISIIFLCLMCAMPAVADENVGLETPFSFGFGARDLSLGGANIANCDFTTAAFWNPARLVQAERYQLSLFHSRLYVSDVAYQYMGIVAPTMDLGTFGIGIARLGVDGIERRDAGNVLLGNTNENRLALFLAYSRTMRGYDVGLAVSMEHHSLDSYTATSSPGVSLSLGRRFILPVHWARHIDFALHGGNIVRPGFDMATQSLEYPFRLDGGVSLFIDPSDRGQHSLTLAARIGKPEFGDALWSFGMEYNLLNQFHLRGGFRTEHLSAGLGLDVSKARIDYAMVGRDLGTIHMFTLTTSFGLSRSERHHNREVRREAEFSELMGDRIIERNSELAIQLTNEGRQLLDEKDYETACDKLDRALFVVRSNSLDTVQIHELLIKCNERLLLLVREKNFQKHLDSARTKLADKDYVASRYFGGLALSLVPDNPMALDVFRQAKHALEQISNEQDILQQQLTIIDSLLNYGEIDQAVTASYALRQFAPTSDLTEHTVRRAEFEKFRNRASIEYAAANYAAATISLDSALQRFANHQWCINLRERIRKEQNRKPTATPEPLRHAEPLNSQKRQKIEEFYRSARKEFAAGLLKDAVTKWEEIERQAPDYESVREYLVRVYRLIGIEYYGQNQLDQAVSVWQKAAAIDPENSEIRMYMDRTTSEIMKLKELSYDEQ